MTFTDREREELEQIERQLADNDPRLARLLSASGRWDRLRRAKRALWFLLLATVITALGFGIAAAM